MIGAPAGLIVAAPRSGSGKSTLTVGILSALSRRGHTVQPFKCGPDYIDPSFHTAACGRVSFNLDAWAMRPELIDSLVQDATVGCDIAIVEGVMGLFDGAKVPGRTGRGSTADLALRLGWPVLLILDVAAQAETAAAVTLGLHTYREGISIAGVILNNVGSAGHAAMVTEAICALGIPVLGAVPRLAEAQWGERHLGLIQAQETADLAARIDAITRAVASGVDLDALIHLAQQARLDPSMPSPQCISPPGQRIALAQDVAFSFIYPHVVAGWRKAGAEIVPFSPLRDEAPDSDCDAVWLPGGYPELHAGALAAARGFHQGMGACVDRGVAVHGECGGYMVLGAGLEDAEGRRHAMVGLLGLETSFKSRLLHLGNRQARLTSETLLGHEFHYSSVLANPDAPYAEITDATGQRTDDQGSRRGNVTGTFFHFIDRES